ncbi:hypothetical protein [Streptomyces canus]|uniref:hypothetical protein n=1 Tax=Streptomyces canus TaxID=58343 RepID=UPI0036EDBAE7
MLDAQAEGEAPLAGAAAPGAVLSFVATKGMESMLPGSTVGAARGKAPGRRPFRGNRCAGRVAAGARVDN